MGVGALYSQPLASDFSHSNKIITAHKRSLSTASFDSGDGEFSDRSAYDVLGVSESSSAAEIKASFRKLAKETHPDVSGSSGDLTASRRFLQILAAYEILSDSNKRAHYDCHLFSQRKILQKHDRSASVMYMHSSSLAIPKDGEVVEWLKWYRLVIDDIVTERRVAVGSGYFDKLECELYAAIRAAYYGPLIESMDFLPDCFEAEERSCYETSEVLHLVSGRDLFGILSLVDKFPQLSDVCHEKVTSSNSVAPKIFQYDRQTQTGLTSSLESPNVTEIQDKKDTLDVYKGLELHIYGQLIATATRSPPTSQCSSTLAVDHEDQINVFLSLDGNRVYGNEAISSHNLSSPVRSRILLGTISGLGNKAEEGTCSIFDRNGTKTHVIMKHRTLMVKHMHWYQVKDEVSACECRCSRARLPPSKFWLFEPRSGMHDIGGWYVETFGRDKKGRTLPSQRQWDSMVDHDKRLHPAMYLVALAYRTLDLEEAKRRKRTLRDFFEPKLYGVLRWWKKLL